MQRSMLGMAYAILDSNTALSTSLSLALPAGGPTAVLWGLLVASFCNVCTAASLGACVWCGRNESWLMNSSGVLECISYVCERLLVLLQLILTCTGPE